MDDHRSISCMINPCVNSTRWFRNAIGSVSMVKTMSPITSFEPSSLYAATFRARCRKYFDLESNFVDLHGKKCAELLRTSKLPLPAATAENSSPRTPDEIAYARDQHTAAYWQKRLGDMDFDVEDKLDSTRFNRELWKEMIRSTAPP